MLAKLSKENPWLLWFRLLGQSTHSGNKRDYLHARFVNELCQQQIAHNRHAVIDGRTCNLSWGQPLINSLLTNT
eukprot:1211422-Karenia_brevis.AAC.1